VSLNHISLILKTSLQMSHLNESYQAYFNLFFRTLNTESRSEFTAQNFWLEELSTLTNDA
jgi:hypothetical protein